MALRHQLAPVPTPPGGARSQGVVLRPPDRVFRLALIALALYLLGSLLYPFASALLFAAVLAGALHPWFERLAVRLGRRRRLAAVIVTVAVSLLVVVPLTLLAVTLGGVVVDGIDYVRETLAQGGVPALVQRLPPATQSLARRLAGALPQRPVPLEELAGNHSGAAARAMGGVLAATGAFLLKIGMTVVAFYFLLLEGPRLVDWLVGVTPLPESQSRQLLGDFRNVSVAVLLASMGTAGIQSLAALTGYLLAGVPRPLFFTMVTFIVAFVPAIGATSVVVALAALMWLGNQPRAALFLLAWGLLVVGLVDNVLKPWLMRGRMHVHGALIFFALFGGLAAFGPVGLLAGPLVLAYFLAVVRIWPRAAEPPA
jgi:predicted PurR-regulated permease PerM